MPCHSRCEDINFTRMQNKRELLWSRNDLSYTYGCEYFSVCMCVCMYKHVCQKIGKKSGMFYAWYGKRLQRAKEQEKPKLHLRKRIKRLLTRVIYWIRSWIESKKEVRKVMDQCKMTSQSVSVFIVIVAVVLLLLLVTSQVKIWKKKKKLIIRRFIRKTKAQRPF